MKTKSTARKTKSTAREALDALAMIKEIRAASVLSAKALGVLLATMPSYYGRPKGYAAVIRACEELEIEP